MSKQSSEAVIVDEAGSRLVSRKVPTDPQAMAAFLAKHGANVVSVGFEASTWLYHELKGAGLPVVCIDSWRARSALSARLNKTDRTDAAGLADLLRAGFHRPVYVESYAAHEVRTMLKARDTPSGEPCRIRSGDCWKPSGRSLARVRAALCRAGRGRARQPAVAASPSPCSRSGRPLMRRRPRCIGGCGRWPGPMRTAAG